MAMGRRTEARRGRPDGDGRHTSVRERGADRRDADDLATAVVARRSGDYDGARDILEVVAHRATAAGDGATAGAALVELGVVASLRGDARTASLLYRRGLTLQRRHAADADVAQTLTWIGH